MSVERIQQITQTHKITRENQLRAGADTIFCQLDAQDLNAAVELALQVFAENRFYQTIMGLDASRFAAYWHELIPLVLEDANSYLFGAKVGGELRGFIVVNNTHFPSFLNGLRFLLKLGHRIGPLPLLRYLRFVTWWEGLMRRRPEEQRCEMRGTWILVGKGRRGALLGIQLARQAIEDCRREGKTVVTGFADADNSGLLAFYQRLGFKVSDPHSFKGRKAVTLELWINSQGAL